MERRNFILSAEVTQLAPGWSAKVRPIDHFKKKFAGSTSLHETYHAVAAILTGTEVEDASSEPGPGFLGRTRLKAFNGIAFVAAHAMGCDGTGHDLGVLEYKKHNIGGLAEAARKVLRDREDEIHAVAVTIEEEGTVSGDRIKKVMDEAGKSEVEITVVGPNGQERNYVSKVRKGENHTITIGLEDKNKRQDKEEKENKPGIDKLSYIRPLVNKIRKPADLMEYRDRLVETKAV